MFEVLWSNVDSVVYKLKAQQMKQPTVLLQMKQIDLFMSDFGSSDMCLFNYFCISRGQFSEALWFKTNIFSVQTKPKCVIDQGTVLILSLIAV